MYTDPISLGVLEAPANYGATICVGDLHGLGLHLNFGGGQAGFIASHDDMRYITEFKELVDGMVETTVPEEQGYSVVLIERTHYAMRGKRKRIYRNPEQSVDRARGCLPVPHGPERHGGNRPYHYDQRKIRSQKLAGIPGVSLRFPSVFFKGICGEFRIKPAKQWRKSISCCSPARFLAAWTCPGIIQNLVRALCTV